MVSYCSGTQKKQNIQTVRMCIVKFRLPKIQMNETNVQIYKYTNK